MGTGPRSARGGSRAAGCGGPGLRGPRAGQGTGAAGPLSSDKGRAREWPSLAQSLLRAREHCVRGVAFSSVRCTSACHLFNPRGHRPEHCEVEVRRRLGGVRLVGTGGVGDWAGRAALAQGRRAGPAHPGVREDGRGKGRPAARAWFLMCVSGGSCVCRLLSWGWLGCPARNTGLPGTPLPPRGCPPRLPSKQLILGQVGAVSAGAPRPFPAEAALAWALQAQEPGLRFPGGPAAVLLAASPAFPTGALQGASARRSAGSGDPPPRFRPVWRTVGPLLTSCHCNPFLSTPPFSSGVSTPQRQSRRPPGVHVKPSLAAVSVVAGSRSGRGGRVAGAARAALWPLAELARGARGRGWSVVPAPLAPGGRRNPKLSLRRLLARRWRVGGWTALSRRWLSWGQFSTL